MGMTVFTFLSLMPPLLMRYLINDVIQPKLWDLVVPVIVAIILVPVLSSFVQFVNIQIVRLAGYRFIGDMRMAIYRKVLALGLSFHQENSSGMLVNRLMDDVNMLLHLVTGETVNMLIDIIVFIFSVSIVFTLSPLLAGLLVLVLVLYVLAYRVFAKRIRSESKSYRFIYDRISERLEETTAGVRHVRIYNREPWENDVFLGRTTESLEHARLSRLTPVALETACNAIAGIGSATIVALGAYFDLKGEMQYGDILAIGSYIWMALNPAIRLTNLAGQLTETFVSVRRIQEILDQEPEITSHPGAEPIRATRGEVEFKNVTFSYVPGVQLYQDLSLHVEPGMSVALVGHTGCGKTTFTTLLMRYWDIQKGQILIDGQEIRSVDLKSLRRLFGVVLQDPVVFDGTLAENIAYGDKRMSRERIEEAARVAEIYEMATRLPDGFDTKIGTKGVKLSVGEKQRVSIARAILMDPLILVMDEATSSLDSESEALIQKALNKVLRGRTSFVVAHRLSTITSSDMIVVMDNGEILETGTHPELMRIPGGHYRQLYEELRGKNEAAV